MITKQELLDCCISTLKNQFSEAKKTADELQEQTNDYGQNKDRYDSFRTKMMRTKDMYLQQMEKALNTVKILTEIDPYKKCVQVEHGAIVITDKQTFFIAAGIGKINYKSKDFYVISFSAPIFQAMKCKRQGDSFIFNGKKQLITTIL